MPPQAPPAPPPAPPAVPPAPALRPAVAQPPDPNRFTAARGDFTRFAKSGGGDERHRGRAISGYVATSSGGARLAAQRMGSSRTAGGRLLSFLSSAVNQGTAAALQALNLGALAGRPVEEIFLGLADYVCPDGGTIDEGIVREAFIETIADLAESGITNIDAMTADQMQTVFELFAAHAIEARICNDIGTKAISVPADQREAARVQDQLLDFIRRGVADALAAARTAMETLTPERVLGFVDHVYEQAFGILEGLAAAEADAP